MLIVAAGLLGVGIVRRLPFATTALERVCLAGAIALTVGPWILFLGAWSLGFAVGAPFAGAAMLLAGFVLARTPV
ncbi:MAG TPA: hypothetical protein VF469_32300, partial [Kofleriaceae bacterium]